MIMWWEPHPWSEPAVPSFVPFVLKVLLKSEAVNVVTWLCTPSSTVAELKRVEGLAQLLEEGRVGRELVRMQVESPEAREEDLAGEPELRGDADHLGDHLQLGADATCSGTPS